MPEAEEGEVKIPESSLRRAKPASPFDRYALGPQDLKRPGAELF
mgnify:CR=1 FL=1